MKQDERVVLPFPTGEQALLCPPLFLPLALRAMVRIVVSDPFQILQDFCVVRWGNAARM